MKRSHWPRTGVSVTDSDFIREYLKRIGENPDREGLKDTPRRVCESWTKIFGGYAEDPRAILRVSFTEGACKELVLLKGIEFYSTCEHHLMSFLGTADVGYIPNGRVVGVSKLARVVDLYSRRLQIQEQLTSQVADAIWECLDPRGVMVVMRARHLCMMARGVQKQNSIMVTSAIRGIFETDSALRAEFLELTKEAK